MTPRLLIFLFLAGGGSLASAVHGAPAHDEPGLLALDVYSQGPTVDLLLAFGDGEGARLEHRRSLDGGRTWQSPVTIPTASRPLHSPHRGSDPQLAAAGDRLVALWTTPGTSSWGSGPLATAVSSDGGRTWSSGPNPADDGSTDGHGYADLAADAGGRFHAVWLDSRDGAQGLRAARSADGGRSWQPNRTLDPVTCECCWNRLLEVAPGELRVIYRDKDPRDLAVAGSGDGGATWRRLATAGAFDWRIEACPHAGGALAVVGGERLAALVWTGERGKAGLYGLGSMDRGRSWSEPRPLPDPDAHRGDLAASGGTLLAVWDALPAGGGHAVRASRSTDGGATWQAPWPLSPPGVDAVQPRVVAVEDGFLVAWSETPDGGVSRLGQALLAQR